MIWILIYHSVIVVFLTGFLLNFTANLFVVRRLKNVSSPNPITPFVSVLVPARNEESGIERCLRSLQSLDYPSFEVIILDDQSTDKTNEIARKLGFHPEGSKCRLIEGEPLKEGWVGKPWACHQLSKAAQGDYLLFTDADTDHKPHSLSAAMKEVLNRKSDLLTLWPRQSTLSWSEKLIIPILYVAAGAFPPHWILALGQRYPFVRNRMSSRQWSGLGVANGQYVLFSRSGYQLIGGHVAVKNHLVEDVGLGRIVASKTREGMILTNCDGTDLVETRMYYNFREVWEGFTKNAWPVFEGRIWLFLFGLTGQAIILILPFLLICLPGHFHVLIGIQIFLILLLRLVCAIRFESSFWSVLWHPFGYFLATLIAVNSYLKSKSKGLKWKDRIYQA